MKKVRKNTTINPKMLQRAEEMMEEDVIDDFSEFVTGLIRAEYARRHPTKSAVECLKEIAPPYPNSGPTQDQIAAGLVNLAKTEGKETSYLKGKKKRAHPTQSHE